MSLHVEIYVPLVPLLAKVDSPILVSGCHRPGALLHTKMVQLKQMAHQVHIDRVSTYFTLPKWHLQENGQPHYRNNQRHTQPDCQIERIVLKVYKRIINYYYHGASRELL